LFFKQYIVLYLLMRHLIAEGISELTTQDGQTYVRVVDEEERAGLLYTTIDMAWPASKDGNDRLLDGPARRISKDHVHHFSPVLYPTEYSFLLHYGEVGLGWNWFEDLDPSARVVTDLGYSASTSSHMRDGYIHQTVKASAPNLIRWQELTECTDEGTIRFVAYEGGQYPALYAIRSMVGKHTVFMANRRPDMLHDLAEHPIGWFVLGGSKMLNEIERQTKRFLDRAEIEETLPLEGITKQLSDKEKEFMNPAQTFLRRFWSRLDRLSTKMATRLCLADDNVQNSLKYTPTEALARTIDDVFCVYSSEPPDSLIEPIEDEAAYELAVEAMERFRLLGELATSLKN
jgi:hypothetical protein